MARTPRDYAAEHAARIRPGRLIRRGQFAGERVGVTVPTRVGTGHAVPAPIARAAPLPRLPKGATQADIDARRAEIQSRKRRRHAAAVRRAAIAGERSAYGVYEDYPGSPGSWHWKQYRWTAAGLARLTRDVHAMPADTRTQANAFGDLVEGYAVDWRGSRDQWRRIGTGDANPPETGTLVGGAEDRTAPDWDAGSLRYLALGTTLRPGPFELVELVEIRHYL